MAHIVNGNGKRAPAASALTLHQPERRSGARDDHRQTHPPPPRHRRHHPRSRPQGRRVAHDGVARDQWRRQRAGGHARPRDARHPRAELLAESRRPLPGRRHGHAHRDDLFEPELRLPERASGRRAGQGEQDGLAARPRKVGRAEAGGGEGRRPQAGAKRGRRDPAAAAVRIGRDRQRARRPRRSP